MHTNLSLELLHYVSEKMLVEIFSAQERVSIGGLHLENTLLDLQDRDIERPTAEIIDCDSARPQEYSLERSPSTISGSRSTTNNNTQKDLSIDVITFFTKSMSFMSS